MDKMYDRLCIALGVSPSTIAPFEDMLQAVLQLQDPRLQEAAELVGDLADWSRRYPRETTKMGGGGSSHIHMDADLEALETRACALTEHLRKRR